MSRYDRSATIRGLDLEAIAGVSIDTIRPDSAPTRNITSTNLAFDDGETVLRANYGSKAILVSGHIYTPDRWDYETARDELLGALDSERELDMIFEQSGSLRRYTGVYENIAFTYIERGLSTFLITFRATKPFGVNMEETVAIAGDTITSGYYENTIYINGNVYNYPRVVLTLNSWVDISTSRTITIQTESEGKVMNLTVTAVFREGSTIVIDGNQHQVTINGVSVPYVGRFPRGKKTMKIKVSDNATSRIMTLQVRYNERNM